MQNGMTAPAQRTSGDGMGCNHGAGVVRLHFWLHDMVGPPDHIERRGAFLDFGSDRLGHPCEVALCHGRRFEQNAKCPPVWV